MRVALTGRMYAGKTTYAKHLQNQGFYLINFTDLLKRRAVDALRACGSPVTLEDILKDKQKYRGFLQELGVLIGFDDEPRYVLEACEDWLNAECPDDVVFDNVRTLAQWEVLNNMGFTLVEVVAPEEERLKRAERAGVRPSELYAVELHPIEGALCGLGERITSIV